ncbi:hypothetical protein [Halomonas organivorans]|uniref:DUF2946 domain-containing protein n=1 Tax=Halomonas organivorans TaxID=257772 RepID=A0A7W5BZH7_9GAMM|nr:hypothetical protein [Halomonas organivorans]MBB3142045.1 hypothetical protein [Halomonas organivorans]
MTSLAWTPHSCRLWQRLLALLLVMTLAIASLSSHASTEACQAECATFQLDSPDSGDACGTACAAPVASRFPAAVASRGLTAAVVTLASDHVPQPPRRPPRS